MKTAVVYGLIVLSAASAGEGDLSGRWVISQDRDFRGNRATPGECTFTQRREALTVRCSAPDR